MNDFITNQVISYRARLSCLNETLHRAIWQNQPPLKFTAKVTQATTLVDELESMAGRQSQNLTGHTVGKRDAERALEDGCHELGNAVAVYATDQGDPGLAARYERPISGWRRLRDAALIQQARELVTSADTLATGPNATEAAEYGITPDAVTDLTALADAYDAALTVPKSQSASRSALTELVQEKSRETGRKFDELEALLPQYGGTPAGREFVTAYRRASIITDLGHRFRPEVEPPAPADGEPGGNG